MLHDMAIAHRPARAHRRSHRANPATAEAL